eukprot:s2072_g12.t1
MPEGAHKRKITPAPTSISTLDRRPVTKAGCPAKWFSYKVPSGFNARQACSNATLPSGDHDDTMFRGSSSLFSPQCHKMLVQAYTGLLDCRRVNIQRSCWLGQVREKKKVP